jgi:predicted Na+-dependent transporter
VKGLRGQLTVKDELLMAKDGELEESKVRHGVLGLAAGHAILPYVGWACACAFGSMPDAAVVNAVLFRSCSCASKGSVER